MDRKEFERVLTNGGYGLKEAMIRYACLKGQALHGQGDISVEKWDLHPYTCPGAGGQYAVFLHGVKIAEGVPGMTPVIIAANPMFLSESILILRALGIDIDFRPGVIDTEFLLTYPSGQTKCLVETDLYNAYGYPLNCKETEKL